MKISKSDWNNYINGQSAIKAKANELMAKWIEQNGVSDRNAMIEYAYALSTKYGEAAAAYACQMYDEIAEAAKANVASALPAETATFEETSKAVNGSLKQSPSGRLVSGTVERLVKQAGADTVLQNAARDQAWYAWVPSGMSCAFCLMIGSNGWKKASKKLLNNHAEHIHANCDCEFVVGFDPFGEIAGYNPDKLLDKYNSFSGSSSDKMKAWRNELREFNKEKINEQKRILYKEQNNKTQKSGGLFGAYTDKNDPNYKKRTEAAKNAYEEIRNRKSTYEISAIANNTGFSNEEIEKIYNHVFVREHLFENGKIDKFEPDYYMAVSWQRLREGKNIQEHDLILLKHELAEEKIMGTSLDITYESVHNEVQKKYNYQKALMKYLQDHDA